MDRIEFSKKRWLASEFPTSTTHESMDAIRVIQSCRAAKRTENAMGSKLGRRREVSQVHALG
jgi:hypothetical protein